jgi:hypothetical protein
VPHVAKWQLALDIVDELIAWGLPRRVVQNDGGYGDITAFRVGVEQRDIVSDTVRAARAFLSPKASSGQGVRTDQPNKGETYMFRISRLVAVATATTVLALVAGAPSAMAAGAEVTVCQFIGLTGQLNPGVPSILPGLVFGGSGTYSFSTSGSPLPSLCVNVLEEDVLDEAEAAVGTVSISASGGYDNILCGTGNAGGSATLTGTVLAGINQDGDLSPEPSSATADYHILFAGGQGVLTGTFTDGEDTGILAGYVNIVPDPLTPGNGNCIGGPVKAFRVTGAFVGVTAAYS